MSEIVTDDAQLDDLRPTPTACAMVYNRKRFAELAGWWDQPDLPRVGDHVFVESPLGGESLMLEVRTVSRYVDTAGHEVRRPVLLVVRFDEDYTLPPTVCRCAE